MLKNKIISAVITLIIGIFIIPLFIGSTYSIAYGIYGTAFTAPAMVIAVIVSILIEKYSKNKNVIFMYIKHLLCALIFSLLFSLVNFNANTIKDTIYLASLMGSIYITIFVIFDYLLRSLNKSR
ncbi:MULTISPECIES: hypothetical protein [unclassified Lysinibacillus]|jgi:chromate transport protein ChrA|uniref:hypothetical protein n=1 Tax=unclassified Lysinibacillus TaxID=2636778 RepID=UPI0008873F49|nr:MULTISPECIES: hypothetical protein [unclassified Lysinibacillus]SCY98628.1 hypothetical protein SAMN02787078_03409 [Lysinibacillus sp. SG9]SDB47324.1 hypothetical protein SAMN02787079_03654 [Lysinibacillus sp. TC-37]SFT12033.1 hypothetical protein SAMN02787087_03711 [Lysinibacillus sp. SG55]